VAQSELGIGAWLVRAGGCYSSERKKEQNGISKQAEKVVPHGEEIIYLSYCGISVGTDGRWLVYIGFAGVLFFVLFFLRLDRLELGWVWV